MFHYSPVNSLNWQMPCSTYSRAHLCQSIRREILPMQYLFGHRVTLNRQCGSWNCGNQRSVLITSVPQNSRWNICMYCIYALRNLLNMKHIFTMEYVTVVKLLWFQELDIYLAIH